MKKIILAIFVYFFTLQHSFAQNEELIYISQNETKNISIDTLWGNKNKYKIKSYNLFFDSNSQSKFLIHLITFSDSLGNFKKEKVKAHSLNDVSIVKLSSLFASVKENVWKDQQREITYFHLNTDDYKQNPIIQTGFKVVEEDLDGNLWRYHDPSVLFFYEVKAY